MSTKKPAPLSPIDRSQRYTVEEALRYLRISRATFYKCVGLNANEPDKINIIKCRGRTFIGGAEIARLSGAQP